MESIVLHSDIARLVLGYFVNNDLKRAALTLCRTSPHLHQEFIALRQGLQPHNFLNGGLEDIIREHVKITSMVTSALQKLPSEARQRLQQLKLSERVSELFKLDKSVLASTKESASMRSANAFSSAQRKRRRGYGQITPSDGEARSHSGSPSPTDRLNCKRRRTLDPHLYCSIGRSLRVTSDNTDAHDSLDSSTATDLTSEHTDDALHFDNHGHGPKKNSTPRTNTSEKAELKMPVPQTMPEITHAIMTNQEFQTKLLKNINTALQSLTVHAPTVESVDSEAVLDGLVRNIIEATEKDPSFDRIIEEVVGKELPPDSVQMGTDLIQSLPESARTEPPQTPLIIRTAVASANAAAVNGGNDINLLNGNNGNAIIQVNANNSIGTLIDPNFSISKLIVLNSNESAQKQHPSANITFSSENLLNFAEGASTLADADVSGSAVAVNGAAVGAGQVCVDAINGQLTFPMFLSNEGLLSHLPFLVNNEWLAQQLRSDAFTNMDVSHIEIPLPEPITVAANQLPPNSIIINSAVKQPPPTAEEPTEEVPAQLIAEQPRAPTATERSTSKVPSASAVPASLDSSRLVLERVTPQTSGIVNVKAFRSLSTPRKRTSHVRTLNFSPKGVTNVQSTPLSTRRLQQKPTTLTQRRTQQKALKEQQAAAPLEAATPAENPVVIKSVEILPSFGISPCVPEGAAAAVAVANAGPTATSVDVSGNESNGCVPPLFAMEESSNQTVIKAVASGKSKLTVNTATAAVGTPKSKGQKRRSVGTKATKRNVSQPAAGKEQQEKEKGVASSLDDSKENKRTPSAAQQPQLPEEEEKEDLMAAWQRQLHCSSTDLEQRLREINAKRQMFQSKVRVRRTRPNKKKALVALQVPQQRAANSPAVGSKKRKQKLKQLKQLNASNVENEFIIKIKTPQKTGKKLKVSGQELKESKSLKSKKNKLTTKAKDEKPGKEQEPLQQEEVKVEQPEQLKQQEEQEQRPEQQQEEQPKDKQQKQPEEEEEQQQLEDPQKDQHNAEPEPKPAPDHVKTNTKDKPPDHNLANMANLLETPFKVTLSDGDVEMLPPTPGPALMDTPYAKLLPSTSFLFGSDTKSILDTPMLTAITPGVRLTTPFSHSLGTPHSSGAKTDYSGGSSYYRPDEAEHMDTNAQCALPSTSPRDLGEQLVKQTATCIELQAERVPVEPTVLRRVRSFGSEAVDSIEGAAAVSGSGEQLPLVETPHYKLVSGLPDAVIDQSSSSSSGSSSTSSSSSSSSSASSSNSSSNTTASSSKSGQQEVAVSPPRTMKLLELDNLSDISSTEDEEWVKTAAGSLDIPPLGIDSQPALLVSQDGEVRYPLRSWLTPSKDAAAAAAADADTSGEMAPPVAVASTASATVATKSVKRTQKEKTPEAANLQAESIEQRMLDLAKVRERVKAKVKQLSPPKVRAKKVNKKLTTMRESAQLANPKPIQGTKSPSKDSQTAKTEKAKAGHAAQPVKGSQALSKPVAKAKPSPASSELAKTKTDEPEASNSKRDPAVLFALNLSSKKQQLTTPKIARAAVQIDAQPAPTTIAAQRRGRPKKQPNAEPARCSMRRSSRLLDNKTPAPEEKEEKPAKVAANSKVTKKPAKKRAEARIETPLATLAEAQTTQESPEQLQPQKESPPAPPPAAGGEYDLDLCKSTSHLASTYSFSYADSGSKPAQPIPSQPAAFFKNFQMRIMVESEMHTVRITSPQLLHHSLPSSEDSAQPTTIRNIPKKRIRIRFPSGSNNGNGSAAGAPSQNQAADKPMASSTPLTKIVQTEEHDDNDLEVATINTPLKANTSEEQHMEGHDDVQIEDIESILSHLHGK